MVRIPAHARATPERFISLDTASGEFDQFFPEALPGTRAVLFTSQKRRPGQGPSVAIVAVDLRSGARHTVVANVLRARYVSTGHLVYATNDGTLMAAPFNARTQTITGPPFVMATDLSQQTITLDFAVSNTGRLAYVVGQNATSVREAVWVSRDGKVRPVDSTWQGNFVDPALSPDGTQLAVSDGVLAAASSTFDIWIKHLDNEAISKLTVEGGRSRFPVWSADGKSIVYSSEVADTIGVREKPANGSATAKLLVRGLATVPQVTQSPDRQWLVYSAGSSLQSRIFAAHSGDSIGHRLFAEETSQRAPVFSPDGRWLAYAVNEKGTGWQIYVSPFPNTAAGKWQVSRNGGSDPQWSRHGAELLFRETSTGMLVAVPVATVPSFTLGKPQPLFSALPFVPGTFAVAPDGSRMLFLQRVGGASERLTFVENWTREVGRH
jgi:hypothetical protein